MLSSALSQLLERARTRFGLEVEVLDAGLRPVYPQAGSDLSRMIEDSPALRRSLQEALAAGRPEQVDNSGLRYHVFPLRRSARTRHMSGLMAVRSGTSVGTRQDLDSWSELARAMIEADFSAAETLSQERQRSRRLLATLQFLRHLVELESDAELAHAIVQAAAVWFDIDARIYEQDLAGDLVLHTALPAARVEEAERRLSATWLSATGDAIRLGPLHEWGEAAATSETVLVPLAANGRPEWILALVGPLPADAEPLLPVLGRIVGVQLDTIRARRRDRTREHFESLLVKDDTAPELRVVQMIRSLAEMTSAASTALTLNRHGQLRRLVSIAVSSSAAAPPANTPAEWSFTADRFVCLLPLTEGVSATLELGPAPGERLTADAALVTRVAARLLQSWLVGAEPTLSDDTMTRVAVAPEAPAFVKRIEQELERARRFDLALALVLIDIPRPPSADNRGAAHLEETLRRELRHSDVLETMNGQCIGALLTHTDAPGSFHAVGRLRRRLAEAAEHCQLTGVTLGHAVFSPECRTAEALVSQATRDAGPLAG
jgi:hypothetical protein